MLHPFLPGCYAQSHEILLAGKEIVFRFFIEYSSLRDFGPWVIGLFLYADF
jgi:hypothetical protein